MIQDLAVLAQRPSPRVVLSAAGARVPRGARLRAPSFSTEAIANPATPPPTGSPGVAGARLLSPLLDAAVAAAAQESASGATADAAGLTEQERRQVAQLKARDAEVRRHEQAHANAGGAYAGTPRYSYERGPDGRSYAVGGTTPIDASPVRGDPQATVRKMEQVRRAALAPGNPSPQDRRIAGRAEAERLRAQAEAARARAEETAAFRVPDQGERTPAPGEADPARSGDAAIPSAGGDQGVPGEGGGPGAPPDARAARGGGTLTIAGAGDRAGAPGVASGGAEIRGFPPQPVAGAVDGLAPAFEFAAPLGEPQPVRPRIDLTV